MNNCNHKWVMYQPFTGEAYECCANAGCGIRKDEYDKQTPMNFQGEHTVTYKPVDLTAGIDSLYSPWTDGTSRRD